MAENTPTKGAAPAPMADSTYAPATDGPRPPAPPPQPSVEEGPPRLFVPHVQRKLRAETRAVGESLNATFVDVTGDDTAYFSLMEKMWSAGKGFLLLEEDVVPTAALLEELWACNSEWCVAWFWIWGGTMMPDESRPQYPWRHCITDTLALSKFGSSLLRRAPRAMQDAASRTNHRKHFNMLDLALVHENGVLQNHPYFAKPHLHGPVEHRPPPAWLPLIGDSDWADG